MRTRHVAAIAALLLGSASLQAQPVTVDYTVSGAAGNWQYSFTLTNNMVGAPANMGLYFLGIQLDGGAMSGGPATWANYAVPYVGGPSMTSYDLAWKQPDKLGVLAGSSLSGFTASSFGLTAPETISWIVWGFSPTGQSYTGGGNFNGWSSTPGFEGSSNVTKPEQKNFTEELPLPAIGDEGASTVTPEPSTYALMACGLAALGFAARRRRGAVAAQA